MNKIFLTKHPELRWLMSFEFHKDGDVKFDPSEPDLYLKRLHPIQRNMLNYRVKADWLTAIITFGDGNIDHTMGDIFHKTTFVVHPNASLGLFYKHPNNKGGDIELVFYTRFLAISYAVLPITISKRVKIECRKLETTKNSNTRIAIKKEIMKYMLKLNTIKRIPTLDEGYGKQKEAEVSHFKIVDWWWRNDIIKKDKIWVPWIAPKRKRMIRGRLKLTTPRWLVLGNTIHGFFCTCGCWMLFRNFLWLWPNEYLERKGVTGDTNYYKTRFYYTGLSRCYAGVEGKKSSSWLNTCIKKVLKHQNSPSTPYMPATRYKMFYFPDRNLVYYEFIRLFSGLKYTHFSNRIMFPKNPLEYEVSEDSSAKNKFKTNITIPGDNYLKDEILHFSALPGVPAKIKEYKSTGGTITLYVDLPNYPKKGDKFFISRKLNCWKVGFTQNYGPNFFGHNCASDTNRFWADVYVFKRTDRFTDEKNDNKQFQSS